MFVVIASFELTKDVSVVTEYTCERDALLDYYKAGGNSTLHVISNDTSIGQYLQKEGVTATRTARIPIGRVPKKSYDDPHQMVVTDANDPSPIDEIVKKEGEIFGGECGIDYVSKERIATVLEYPEFAIFWEDIALTIGCIRVVLTVPRLYSRKSSYVLYAYVGHSSKLGQYVINSIIDCAKNAAIAAAVIGVVLANFAAGVAAFQPIFERCITYKFTKYLACLVPGLAILYQQTDWARV
jgi:hypothetical protein